MLCGTLDTDGATSDSKGRTRKGLSAPVQKSVRGDNGRQLQWWDFLERLYSGWTHTVGKRVKTARQRWSIHWLVGILMTSCNCQMIHSSELVFIRYARGIWSYHNLIIKKDRNKIRIAAQDSVQLEFNQSNLIRQADQHSIGLRLERNSEPLQL